MLLRKHPYNSTVKEDMYILLCAVFEYLEQSLIAVYAEASQLLWQSLNQYIYTELISRMFSTLQMLIMFHVLTLLVLSATSVYTCAHVWGLGVFYIYT